MAIKKVVKKKFMPLITKESRHSAFEKELDDTHKQVGRRSKPYNNITSNQEEKGKTEENEVNKINQQHHRLLGVLLFLAQPKKICLDCMMPSRDTIRIPNMLKNSWAILLIILMFPKNKNL